MNCVVANLLLCITRGTFLWEATRNLEREIVLQMDFEKMLPTPIHHPATPPKSKERSGTYLSFILASLILHPPTHSFIHSFD